MMSDMKVIVNGLCFGEGPRWHEDALWISDMHDHKVLKITCKNDDEVQVEEVVTVPGRPSGLGFYKDSVFVVSMTDRKLMKFDLEKKTMHEHGDMSILSKYNCNDMIMDLQGRAYVGNFGFDLHAIPPAKEKILTAVLSLLRKAYKIIGKEFKYSPVPSTTLLQVLQNGEVRVAAHDLLFPNGTVITPDGKTMIVAESFGSKLTAFDIDAQSGDLSNRRTWAKLTQGVFPDGICLDEDGGIWVACPNQHECVRLKEGANAGDVTHRLKFDQGAYACMLDPNKNLYVLTAPSHYPDICAAKRGGKVVVCKAPYAHAGLP